MARPPMFIDCPDGSRVWFNPSLSDEARAWMIEEERRRWTASEPVTLADGAADQSLIPGVAPVALSARQLEAERNRREARRGHAGLPCGGLWDETAHRQGSLF